MSADRELRTSPLFSRHQALGARFVEFAGWQMPVQYRGVKQEHAAVREAAGLFDVSHMGELFVSGPGAAAALDSLVTNDVLGLARGRALYTVACNEQGGILDDLIVYHLPDGQLLVVCNAGNRSKMSRHFARQLAERAEFSDRSDSHALLALQGPRAQAIAGKLGGGEACAQLPRFGVASLELAGTAALVARTGYTGEDGFELFCASADAPALWDALLEAGGPLGLQPIGLGARDTLRLEARLMLYGNDIDESTNPYEAGLGWTVKLGKGEFLGQAALRAIKTTKPRNKLVGFVMRGRGIARHGYPLLDTHGAVIGRVTSGAPGLSVGENIGLGYVAREWAAAGTRLGVEIRGKVIEAEVVPTPFYKREATRSEV